MAGYQQNPLMRKSIVCFSLLGGGLSCFYSLYKKAIGSDNFKLLQIQDRKEITTIAGEIQYQEFTPRPQVWMRAVHVAQLIQVLGILYLNKTSPYHWMQLMDLLGTLSYFL